MVAEQCTLPARKVPVLATVDVAVVGGGFPGVCAAIAAARLGASVALIERDGLLGGQAAEIYTFGMDAFVNDNGKQVIKGIPWEIMERTLAEGQSDRMWEMVDYARMESKGVDAEMKRWGLTHSPFMSQTFVDPAAFRHVLQVLVDDEGITTLLESPLTDVLLDSDRVSGVVAMGCYGPFAVKAEVVVDTTPQAAVAALAGHPFAHTKVYVGTHPRVAGVDVQQLLGYIRDNPRDVTVGTWAEPDTDLLESCIKRGIALRMAGFRAARQRAIADDPSYEMLGRDEEGTQLFFYDRDGCGSYWVHSHQWRHTHLDDPLHLARTIAALRKRQWLTHKLFREYVPGFAKAHLVDLQPHIARALLISGEPGELTEYDVPMEHIAKNGDLYQDSIARVVGHPGKGQAPQGFQIPYRSLIVKGLKGLLVTGKPACRFLHIHATNAAVGQAAGVAAAVAVKEEAPLRAVPVRRVQEELEKQGAMVF